MKKQMLSLKEAQTLQFLREEYYRGNYKPSIRSIAKRLRYRSPRSAMLVLHGLIGKKLVTRLANGDLYFSKKTLSGDTNGYLPPFLVAVEQEVLRARSKHPPLNSSHEGYAVILEELDEFWEEVRKQSELQDKSKMYVELVQIAAMAQRTAEDVIRLLPEKE